MKTQLQGEMIPLFDLHCDTLSKLYIENEDFLKNNLHISLEKASYFSPYIQIMAIWSDNRLSNEDAYVSYKNILEYSKNIQFFKHCETLFEKSFILAVEDARILNGDINRLFTLAKDGVKILTLNWQNISIIGGAWNTNIGLTDFGKLVVDKCLGLGIIPDISHSSIKSSEEIIEICSRYNATPIASHSNSYTICKHNRNLTDKLFKKIVKTKGLVGISLASEHLSLGNATINDILKHIYHYLSLDGEDTVCLGCDFDGVSNLPNGIFSISDLQKLYYLFEKTFNEHIAKKIFFLNAFSFFSRQKII